MIKISKPYVEIRGNEAFLIAHVIDEVQHIDMDMWYAVDKEYAPYLCTETADCFVTALYIVAVKTQQNIEVSTPVSTKLYYNLQNSLVPQATKVFNVPAICIEASTVSEPQYKGVGVGCGCSLGVDSLSSIFRHLSAETVQNYRITHLTLFNCGQMGDYDLEASEKYFRNKIERVKPFADEMGLHLLTVNSNLNVFYQHSGIYVTQSVTQRTASCAMALQKLFRHYVFASTYPVQDIRFDTHDVEHQEAIIAPLLSTESFTFDLTDVTLTRVQKTEYVNSFPIAQKYLDVCWAEQTAFEVWQNKSFLQGKTKVNCGWCDKCLRTLLTLDVLGGVKQYGDIFELSKYYEHKQSYIIKVFRERKHNVFYQEIVELMLVKQIKLPWKAKCYLAKDKAMQFVKNGIIKVWYLPKRIKGKIKRMRKG